ncbi:MAG: hypothetical protein HC769_12305 [Cyanobacteria bacterium CRU_2_1]|nr:hypothetical protein [Cyanobacteria bacterium RU_5_0]NJR59555.1 hypothetical protein [Cyanobacteria bacterium CRU_2_1]
MSIVMFLGLAVMAVLFIQSAVFLPFSDIWHLPQPPAWLSWAIGLGFLSWLLKE